MDLEYILILSGSEGRTWKDMRGGRVIDFKPKRLRRILAGPWLWTFRNHGKTHSSCEVPEMVELSDNPGKLVQGDHTFLGIVFYITSA